MMENRKKKIVVMLVSACTMMMMKKKIEKGREREREKEKNETKFCFSAQTGRDESEHIASQLDRISCVCIYELMY